MADNAAALRRGELDVVQVFEPFASALEADGVGYVWYEAARRGPTSYTTFYTRRALLREQREELHGMVRAIYRALKFVARADGAAIADAITGFFPDAPLSLLTAACARYKALGILGADPVLPRIGYDRLLSGLVSGGFVSPGTPFDVAVDNSLACTVIAEDPPPLD
jgi:NitT/TauT family transport system substrate-binding protein